MNGAHDRPIRKFNPGTLQSDEEVVRQFVVRQHELDLVLEVIRGNLDSSSCQHVLIVAPRGRGKTMLLSRVCAELRTNDDLSRRLFPVRFMEESQEIFTLADFWIESLFYLAQACAHGGDPEHSQELLATHADLTARWNDTNIEECAHAAVLEAADRLSKTLVLMVENLQALCGAVDEDFGWRLRKALQSEPQIMLLATATSRFKGLDDATQPFFELFRIVDLEPLDTGECQRLWYMVSGDAGKRREIEPLRILTGGSPRLLVIVAELARHRSLRQLLEDLVTLIDNYTEYFRGHLEVLAKTERRVYLAVIDLWQLSSTGEIAARARMDVRAVSALLGRLVDRGAVLMDGTGRKRRYAAAERLYSIYYKLRRERDDAAIVHYLIQFMTAFYSDDELAALAVSDPELAAYDAVIERFGASDMPDLQVGVAKALVNKGATHGQRGEYEAALATYDAVVERFSASDMPDLQVGVAKALVKKGATHGQRGEYEAALAACDAVVERFGASDAPDLQAQVAKALVTAGTATVTGTVNAASITDDAQVMFTPGAADPATSTITASPTSITADGVTTSTITVQLKDANSNDLTSGGDAVVLSTDLGSLGSVTDNGDGTYTATQTSSTTAGTATVTGTVNAASITDDAQVTFTPGAADPATSTITASPTSITADGVTTSTITVQLKDANSNDLTAGGDAVVLSTDLGSLGSVTDNGDGTYTATLTSSTTAGTRHRHRYRERGIHHG